MDHRALTFQSKARPIHARQAWTEPALCGDLGPSQYTTVRRWVDCAACLAEIERRLARRGVNDNGRPPK